MTPPLAHDRRALERQLRELRRRADEDFLRPPAVHEPGRHRLDLPELGLRVVVTRTRYPNRPDGVDQYAVTVSRLALDRPPDAAQAWTVVEVTFGASAAAAAEERIAGPLVRLFRVPAGTAAAADA